MTVSRGPIGGLSWWFEQGLGTGAHLLGAHAVLPLLLELIEEAVCSHLEANFIQVVLGEPLQRLVMRGQKSGSVSKAAHRDTTTERCVQVRPRYERFR